MDIDAESWIQGYLTGVALHHHLRAPQLFPPVIASMSVTGIAADFDWFADLSGVRALTLMTAEYVGNVTAAYSYDGAEYTESMPMEEFIKVNPTVLFSGCNPETPRLWFRFHLDNDDADMTNFTLYGIFAGEEASDGVP